jgi:hypothetical protein
MALELGYDIGKELMNLTLKKLKEKDKLFKKNEESKLS